MHFVETLIWVLNTSPHKLKVFKDCYAQFSALVCDAYKERSKYGDIPVRNEGALKINEENLDEMIY